MPCTLLEMVDIKTLSLPTKSLRSRRRDKYNIIIKINNNNKWALCIVRGLYKICQHLMDQGMGLVREDFSEEVISELNLKWWIGFSYVGSGCWQQKETTFQTERPVSDSKYVEGNKDGGRKGPKVRRNRQGEPYIYQIKEPGPYPVMLLKHFKQERHMVRPNLQILC